MDGGGSDPEYTIDTPNIDDEEILKQYLPDYDYNSSLESYRGVDIERNVTPPPEWFEKEISKIEKEIEFAQKYLGDLKDALKIK